MTVRSAFLASVARVTPITLTVYVGPADTTSLVKRITMLNAGAAAISVEWRIQVSGQVRALTKYSLAIGAALDVETWWVVRPASSLIAHVPEASSLHSVLFGSVLDGVEPHSPQFPALLGGLEAAPLPG